MQTGGDWLGPTSTKSKPWSFASLMASFKLKTVDSAPSLFPPKTILTLSAFIL